MKDYLPILIAFLGAAFGAYFAIVKSKKERVWEERYKTLHDIVCDLDLIYNKFSIEQMEGKGVTVSSNKEKLIIDSAIDRAKTKLSTNISKLELLFHSKHVKDISIAYIGLNSAYLDLYNCHPSDYLSDLQEAVADKADELKKQVIKLAQKKCL